MQESEAAQDTPEISPDLLHSFLAGRDIACPGCEYNLRDLQGCICPECGEKIVLRVNLAEPKQGLLIAGLVGLSAGAGLSGLLLIYILIQFLRGQFEFRDDFFSKFVVINLCGFIIEGAAIVLWLVKWRCIRNAKFSTRFNLMLLCWALTLINILIFSFNVK